MDVGTGFGNQLRFFLERGCEATAVDTSDTYLDIARENFKFFGFPEVTTLIGKNDQIPVPDESFDVLLSMRAVHYQPNLEAMEAAFKEFNRVLKKGGIAFIQTTGPRDEFRATAERKSECCWLVKDYGFRSGHDIGFFDDETHLKNFASRYFSEVETGTLYERYPRQSTFELMSAVCRK